MISSSVRNLFTRLAKPLGIRSDEADRERMSRLNGHGFFSAVDALLLTDCSPVADALSRCCLDDREGSDATSSIKPYQCRFNEDTHTMSIHTQQSIRKQLLQVTALAWGLRAPVRQYAPATRARSTLAPSIPVNPYLGAEEGGIWPRHINNHRMLGGWARSL